MLPLEELESAVDFDAFCSFKLCFVLLKALSSGPVKIDDRSDEHRKKDRNKVSPHESSVYFLATKLRIHELQINESSINTLALPLFSVFR
jgi:hypothetical protein